VRDPRTDPAYDKADALRGRLRDSLKDAQAALTDAEENNRRLHRELDLMTASSARRWLVGARQGASRAARIIRHPFWTVGTVARGLAATPAPAAARRALTHLRQRSLPLRLSSPARRWTSASEESIAIRWIGPINLRHRSFEALLCHPPAGLEYRTKVPAGSRFVCECALSPQVWQEYPPRIDFTIVVQVPAAGGWRQERTISLDPGSRWTDRRWHTIAIDLPPSDEPAVDVIVTLSTNVEGAVATDNAWAIFGEPRFEWRRSTGEMRRSLATFAERLRTSGLRSSFELLRVTGITNPDAESYPRWVARNTRNDAALAEFTREVAVLPYQPRISIVVPVYNTDPQWLRACIESVRRQTYTNWELCLCDDASSSPATIQTLREYEPRTTQTEQDEPRTTRTARIEEDGPRITRTARTEEDAPWTTRTTEESPDRIRIRYSSVNGGISVASNLALELATGDFVALLDHDDELTPDALGEVVKYLNTHQDADILYSDEDKLDLQGARCDVFFKPDWSPEHFLTCNYACHLVVVRRELLTRVGGFRKGYEGAQDYDLLLRLMEHTTRIGHIPRVLYHWRKLPQSTASAGSAKPWALDAGRLAIEDYVKRNAIDADVVPGGAAGLYRIKRHIKGQPLVSLIIPTAAKLRTVDGKPVDMLANAIRSVVEKTDYPHYEFIVVADDDGVPPSTARALEGTRHQVLRFKRLGLFNFSAKINAGVAASSGEQVLFFNDDLEVIAPEWLAAMIEYSQVPEIGAVGAKLLYPDGRLQHIGMVLGVAGVAAHAFHQHPGVSPGYSGSAIMVRNYSAVTAACLMTRRAVFDEAGPFDERFPVDFNDVDYCLRVQRAGYRVVFTPWAQLYHHESASFGLRRHDLSVLEEFRRRWADRIDRDPYYNPNLTRDFPDYRIDA
jgi:O-antigen biosynthesis protein